MHAKFRGKTGKMVTTVTQIPEQRDKTGKVTQPAKKLYTSVCYK